MLGTIGSVKYNLIYTPEDTNTYKPVTARGDTDGKRRDRIF